MSDADKLIEAAAMAIINKEYPMRLALGPISIDEAKEFARAALSAIDAAGWVLVPVEPTDAMMFDGVGSRQDYRAMLYARPRITGGTE